MSNPLRLLAALVLVASSGVRAAESLPVLVDDAPWQVTSPNGMTIEMSFSPDGKGQVKAGPMSRDLTWSVEDGNFCIGGLPAGIACMTLSVEGDTVIGSSTDGRQLVFSHA